MDRASAKCQNCKTDFLLVADDFSFYEQMNVPAPTMCPDCRLQRRYTWRNERALYKAICGLCKKNMLAGYPEVRTYEVYCRECWLGDSWDPSVYGRAIDFSRPFLAQLKELFDLFHHDEDEQSESESEGE